MSLLASKAASHVSHGQPCRRVAPLRPSEARRPYVWQAMLIFMRGSTPWTPTGPWWMPFGGGWTGRAGGQPACPGDGIKLLSSSLRVIATSYCEWQATCVVTAKAPRLLPARQREGCLAGAAQRGA